MRVDTLVRYSCFGLLLTSLCAQTAECDSPRVKISKVNTNIPAKNAYIIKHYVDKPSPDSGYETGNLHIVYSDNTEIVETLRPKEKSTEQNIVFNQEGIDDVKVASDKRAIGWAETYENCCTSYSIPLTLSIYRSRDTILHISQGQMLWYWTFREGGKHVAAAWGPTHGRSGGGYQLYDVNTGHLISEVFGDPESQSLGADAPRWAKETESKYRMANGD